MDPLSDISQQKEKDGKTQTKAHWSQVKSDLLRSTSAFCDAKSIHSSQGY